MEDLVNDQPNNNDGVIMVKEEPISIPHTEEEHQQEGSPVEVQDGDLSPRSNNSSKKSKD